MEGAVDQTFCLPEHLSISAIASYIGTGKLDIEDPDSLVEFLTQSTFESILTGPDFDVPAQEIKCLPMLLDANETLSAPLESCWSINALAVSTAEFVHSYPEVLTLDEDYDDDYDITVEERGSESVHSDPKVLTLGDFGVTGDHLMNVDLPEFDFAELEYSQRSSSNGQEVSINRRGSEQLVLVEPMPHVPSTDSTVSSNYDGEAEEVMKRKRRKLVS